MDYLGQRAGKTTLIRSQQITHPDSGWFFFNEAQTSKHISFIGYLLKERGLY